MGHLSDFIALQLGQGLSGTFADYLALLLACVGIAAALARALDIFPLIKDLHFLLNPQGLTLSSVALWTNGDHISLHHQHLTMFFFLAAMFLRFSGTSEHPKLAAASLNSLIKRWFSRLGEYAILAFALPSFESIARPEYVVPLMIFVATARTNEVFRAWRCPEGGKRAPSEEDQMRKALGELVLQSGISSASTGNLLGLHQLQLEEQEKALFQLGFLWIDGSGMLIIAALTVLMVSIVYMAGSLSLHNSTRWLTICVEVLYVIAAVYLCLQCLPAWIICLEKFGVLVKDDQNQEWLRDVKDWTSDMARFLKDITVSGDSPFMCKDFSTKLGLFFAFIEGLELAPHIVVAALYRILLHSLLLLIAWIVRKLFRLCELLSRMRLISKFLNLLIGDSPYDPWVKIRHFLWMLAATICQQELLTLKGLFQDPPCFILIGVEFIQRDEYSQILFSKRLHGSFRIPRHAGSTFVRKIMDGYCWVEAEGRIGYADLEGTFVRLPLKEIGRENWGVVGGWISTEGDVKSHEWGDSEYNADRSENVGHFFANLNYDAVFQGQSAATLKVWLKFGPKAIRISHWWMHDKSVLVACTCEPLLHDPNVKVLASHITSWPAMTTCKLSLVNESLI